jgi:nucleoid-associated protein Lsr2
VVAIPFPRNPVPRSWREMWSVIALVAADIWRIAIAVDGHSAAMKCVKTRICPSVPDAGHLAWSRRSWRAALARSLGAFPESGRLARPSVRPCVSGRPETDDDHRTKASCPMAREVIEKLIDDLDGGEAAETVTFGLDGATYDIDLSKKNAAAFRKALDRYVKAARRSATSGRPSRRKAAPSTGSSRAKRDYDISQLREWAGTNNVAVPARGRIPQAVVEQYKAAGRP